MAPILELRNVAAAYGDVQALWDVSFAVEQGHIATLLGSNGAGKTTSLRVISGLLPALEGEVLLRGERISGLSPHRIVELGVIQVPEGRHLWPNMTVEDNLLLGAYGIRGRATRSETLRTVYSLFPRLGEPSLGLAPILVDEVFRVLHDIVAQGVTVLLVEQNVHRALEVAQTASVIENGRVVLSKSATDMANDPNVRSAYLGL